MNALLEYIQPFGKLTREDIDIINRQMSICSLQKNAYLSEAGKVPQQVNFVLDGVLRFGYYNNKGEEITEYFIDERHFATDYQNFEAAAPASMFLQAVTDCKILVFSKSAWTQLLNAIPHWDKIVSKIAQRCLAEKIERRSPLVAEDATSRYLSFLQKFPGIANRVPLSYTASYLGITQQSLSRIRKNIR